jgi:hypothetical protein
MKTCTAESHTFEGHAADLVKKRIVVMKKISDARIMTASYKATIAERRGLTTEAYSTYAEYSLKYKKMVEMRKKSQGHYNSYHASWKHMHSEVGVCRTTYTKWEGELTNARTHYHDVEGKCKACQAKLLTDMSKASKARMLLKYHAYMKKQKYWTTYISVQSEKLTGQKSVLVVKTRQMKELKVKYHKAKHAAE